MAGKHEIVFAATDVLRIFPTFVWKAELEPEVYRRINKSIIHRLEQIRRSGPEPAPGQGWRSRHWLTLAAIHGRVPRGLWLRVREVEGNAATTQVADAQPLRPTNY